jgi:CubicO group peptidase (beta-lactamase class C family)
MRKSKQTLFSRNLNRMLILSCLISSLFLSSIPAQTVKTNGAKATLQSREKIGKINKLVQTFADLRLFNGNVLVAEKGKVIFQKSFGPADMEWNIPNRADTKFRIGSVTKQFTAVLILQLKEAGKLDLQAKITDYLPWYRKDTGDRITIHHLLTHSSGIPEYATSTKLINDIATQNYTPQEIAEKFCSGDLEFDPGTKFQYDNSGYFLLGVIIEALTGKSYAENLQEKIFTPLGMKNSGIDSPTVLLQNRAAGYDFGFGGYENADFVDIASSLSAAGAIYSTVGDLFIWQTALDGDKLLSKESKALMRTPNFGRYGYGVYSRKIKLPETSEERSVIAHPGGINGFTAFLIKYVEEETIVILLDNSSIYKRGGFDNMLAGFRSIVSGLPQPKIRQSIIVAMIEKLKTDSGEQSAAFYRRAKSAQAADYDFTGTEPFLNSFGYYLLRKRRVKDSLAVLKLATEEFPLSANTFDSYAEALMKDGQKELAIKNYKRSLELNPQNANAAKQIEILEAQP